MLADKPPHLTIREVPWSNPVGADLRAAQQAELDSRFGSFDHEADPPSAEDTAVFLVAYDKSSGQPLGCGGLRRLDAATAEIKRIYVLPYARGSGVATAVLTALEYRARAAGYAVIKAEAGSAQPDGRRFYQHGGYSVVPNYGPHAGREESACYAKRLGEETRAPARPGAGSTRPEAGRLPGRTQ
ncbi:GNAT family N-acetyltransferase [Arthrobacter sp. zg-ZUI100]|uniref:GNAT family N-acetyltransferase n=1 Tax=Arthrobacter jiangjiafuii TaxID=2817475 RepID=A0A975QZK8_9MICC|nr:GNAT family N-acetyltransferase [Arthrobacter jiangjiafuii]MBP3035565.1 GNAT family N-acetyltransferase [Arthrobacter jiangjiafuii]MBP3042237.1 GNAT family N-acetyltransferase [Arthrobacter jiangjiafuii]QWC09995.1 GNAT family N-acetyltransferase [Arthrobacter jiangjiafuii]